MLEWFTTGRTPLSEPVESHGLKMLVFLLPSLFLSVASPAGSAELYHWTDETGKIHIVDEITKVPERYRHGIKAHPTSSGPNKRSPTGEREVPEPARETLERQEDAEASPPRTQAEAARIEALRREKEKLEQERFRQTILERRFGGARATFYKKRGQEIDRRVEAIQQELDALHPENP